MTISASALARRLTMLFGGMMLLTVVACGSLPRPFEGYAGANAARLAQPPPVRLAVITPDASVLKPDAASVLASALAEALVTQDVPAVATRPLNTDWRLVVTATLQDRNIVPVYTVYDPTGRNEGALQGASIASDLWATGASQTLRGVANVAAPTIAGLLTRIEAARRASDPNSLVNRQIRVAVAQVTGAPGDGNAQLSRNMRDQLAGLGLLVTDDEADFQITGHVDAVPVSPKTTRIEISWLVIDPRGQERGKLVQLNEVPAGSLNRYWGDVAYAVAQEAAGGVKDVVDQQTGRLVR
jgi:hypothetical protein